MNDNTSDNEGDGNTGDGPAISANVAANKNIAEAANRYADRKRLRTDQKAEVAVMVNVNFPFAHCPWDFLRPF
jgi:hypothetical protein